MRNGVVRIDAPHFTWRSASGMADPERGIAMLPEDQFHAASITKMITAATLMALVEQGRIELDAASGAICRQSSLRDCMTSEVIAMVLRSRLGSC